jgi:hypothetical protein
MFFVFNANLFMSCSEEIYTMGDGGTMGCNPNLVQKGAADTRLPKRNFA